ncbi:MAG: peptide chain release factor N(5)-glutamine methyltransferase [Cyclobacteriaceae bacterium]
MYLSAQVMENLKAIFRKLNQQIDQRLPESEREAISFLILDYFGYSRSDFLKDSMVEIPGGELDRIIVRLNHHEPIQYILEQAWFYGRSFKVRKGVLIPRPETELLAEIILNHYSKDEAIRVLDLGTGSGCIPVTLAAERPLWNVLATDISPVALDVARFNAEAHQAKVHFLKSDMLEEIPDDIGTFDVLVSNPPYIPYSERETMQPQVVDHEPHEALFAPDSDPVIFYRAISEWAKKVLVPGGLVLVEIQEKYGLPVRALFEQDGFRGVTIIRDLDNKDRIVQAIK